MNLKNATLLAMLVSAVKLILTIFALFRYFHFSILVEIFFLGGLVFFFYILFSKQKNN